MLSDPLIQVQRNINLEDGWKKRLEGEFVKPYMKDLKDFLCEEKKQGKNIFPKEEKIFQSLNLTSFDNVRLVILGQDPYHGDGQAHGLSFSVPKTEKIPPSLKNIFKEIHRDIGTENKSHGDLSVWGKQGVLLLNSVLTVEKSKPASHSKKGWEIFTDKIIDIINNEKENVVFLLWGRYAQDKGNKINRLKHKVLMTSHPSPFSVYRGFLGSSHFSEANAYLKSKSIKEIDWSVR